jgi:hypothetical protein
MCFHFSCVYTSDRIVGLCANLGFFVVVRASHLSDILPLSHSTSPLCFNCLRNCQAVDQRGCTLFSFLSAVDKGSNFFSTFSPLFICSFLDSRHPSGCETVSRCGFDLHVPDDEWCQASLHVLIGHLLWKNVCSDPFPKFWAGFSFSYWVISSLYTLNRSPLSGICLQTFSPFLQAVSSLLR